MPNFGLALLASHNYYYIESHRQMFEFMRPDEKICRSVHSDLFCLCDGRFSIGEILVSSGFNFHKDYRAAAVCHNKVDFSCFAGEIFCERFITFFFQKLFGLFLSPLSEQISVGRQLLFFSEKHNI